MKKKRIFKRRIERNPVQTGCKILGLVLLATISFSAGVQFGQMDLGSRDSLVAVDLGTEHSRPASTD